VSNFRDYLATVLFKKIEELELRRAKEQAKKEIKKSKIKRAAVSDLNDSTPQKLPFYNWLDS
jgi:hypothetical protein